VPRQLLVYTPRGGNKPTALPYKTSLFDVRYILPEGHKVVELDGLGLYPLPAALVACGAAYFRQQATGAHAALAMIHDASDVLTVFLEGGHSTVAGRLAGAFRNIGRGRIADDILNTMRSATTYAEPIKYPDYLLVAAALEFVRCLVTSVAEQEGIILDHEARERLGLEILAHPAYRNLERDAHRIGIDAFTQVIDLRM